MSRERSPRRAQARARRRGRVTGPASDELKRHNSGFIRTDKVYIDANEQEIKRNSDGRVSRDRSPRRAQARARRGCHVTGPGQQ